jgi:hypothetical protein
MSDSYRVKIQVPNTVVERNGVAEKRMKADAEYTPMDWRVLGIPYGGPIKGRDLDGESFTPDTDFWL